MASEKSCHGFLCPSAYWAGWSWQGICNEQGKGLGELLLARSLERALITSKQQVASWATIVDAKQGARNFYLKHGFIPRISQPQRLFLEMSRIEVVAKRN